MLDTKFLKKLVHESDASRPSLQFIQIKNGFCISTDGHILHHKKRNIDKNIEAYIPFEDVKKNKDILFDIKPYENVKINYPNTDVIIQKKFQHRLTYITKDFLDELKKNKRKKKEGRNNIYFPNCTEFYFLDNLENNYSVICEEHRHNKKNFLLKEDFSIIMPLRLEAFEKIKDKCFLTDEQKQKSLLAFNLELMIDILYTIQTYTFHLYYDPEKPLSQYRIEEC